MRLLHVTHHRKQVHEHCAMAPNQQVRFARDALEALELLLLLLLVGVVACITRVRG